MVGAVSEANCSACPAGTWSDRLGAPDAAACRRCPAGTRQPARGQARESICINCPPGRFGDAPGLEECRLCPAGTFSSSFSARSCSACPVGTWTRSSASPWALDCEPCAEAECGAASTYISLRLAGPSWPEVPAAGLVACAAAVARELAEFLGVALESVVDKAGARARASVSAGGEVELYALETPAFPTRELLTHLSSEALRLRFAAALSLALGTSGDGMRLQLQPRRAELRRFAPQTSRTSTSTSAVFLAAADGAAGGSAVQALAAEAAGGAATAEAVPPWAWFLIGGVSVACVYQLGRLSSWRAPAPSTEEEPAQDAAPSTTPRLPEPAAARRAAKARQWASPELPGREDLPVLLGSRKDRVVVEEKTSELVVHCLRTPTTVSAGSVMREAIGNVEEGNVWWAYGLDDAAADIPPLPEVGLFRDRECRPGCSTSSCWRQNV